jgi:FSR family fosmidomycin resistance protein-like MFS transporter
MSGESVAAKVPSVAWGRRDYFDLTVIGAAHGFSDGFANMLVPVLALIVADMGLSAVEAGMLLSSFSLASFIFLYPLSMLADYTGRKKAIVIVGLSVAAISFILMGWTQSFTTLLALSFLAGVGNSTYHPCGTALTAERFSAHRSFAISWHGMGGNIGTSILPLVQAAVAAVASWRVAIVACAVPVLALLPVVGLRFHGKSVGEASPQAGQGIRAMLVRVLKNRNVILLALVYTLRGIGTKGMIGFLPLIASQRFGMDTAEIGLAVSLYFAAGAVSKPFMGYLYSRWGPRSALIFPLLAASALTIAVPFARWETALILISMMAGVFSFVSPIILTATADLCEPEVLASSIGVIYTLHGLSFIAPLAGGWLAERYDMDVSFYFFGLATLSGIFVAIKLPGKEILGNLKQNGGR